MTISTTKYLFAAGAFACAVAACGGTAPKKSTAAANQKIAEDAPPPPIIVEGEPEKIERTVTKATAKDFDKAVLFYKKTAKGGWTEEKCRAVAEQFQMVADNSDKMVEARFNSGLTLQQCGMNEAAVVEYKKALKISAHAPTLSNLGEIYFKGGNESKAKDYWRQAVKANGRVVAARNNLAWLMIRDLRAGKTTLKAKEQAIKDMLSRALAVDNDNVEAYTLYGLLYMEGSEKNKSRLNLAKVLLDKGESIDRNYAPLHNAQGLLLLRRDNVPQALKSFRRAVELNPDFKEAHRNLGNIVLDFRKYKEAKAEFDKVLALDAEDYEAHIGLGYALRGLKEYDRAEEIYKAARKIDNSRAEADYNLGVLYQDFRSGGTEDLKLAQEAFRTAANYFKQAMAKPKATSEIRKEAKANIKSCEKNVKSLAESIKFAAQMEAENKAQ